MRISFDQLFSVQNGLVQPKVPVHVNGVTMTPGISFGGGVSFGGANLTQFIGKDLDVEKMENGVYNIKGYFK